MYLIGVHRDLQYISHYWASSHENLSQKYKGTDQTKLIYYLDICLFHVNFEK